MDIFYNKNIDFINNINNKNILEIENLQPYIPIYDKFFNFNNDNYNTITLNNKNKIVNIDNKINYNIYNSTLINSNNDNKINKKVFFKYSPLIDPVKYISNKYDSSYNLLLLPKYNENNFYKLNDKNNSAYIDGFFTYLISNLLHNFNFLHGLDFYGSYLCIKKNMIINIYEDIEYLYNNDEFHKNNNILYDLDKNENFDILNYDTRNYKKKLNIIDDNIIDDNIIYDNNLYIELSDINSITNKLNTTFINDDKSNTLSCNNELIFESFNNYKSKNTNSSSSNCSSRSSYTNKSLNESNESNSSHSNTNSNDSSYSSSSNDNLNLTIFKFPIELIALECCDNTLDYHINNNKIKDSEWDSIILQILMTLITYQKVFKLTHNDLHSNNIMYIETDKKYLYYKINNKHYKIPTFGKIYKIIDFGRAIYYFKDKCMCSDSFHSEGDANTQYNFGIYKNNNKKNIDPNYSFDLTRLGCSLFDYFVDDIDDIDKIKSPIKNIILNWCNDKNKKNILYKKNGDERYPDFKLYKMITRLIDNHIPIDELNNIYFQKYIVSRKNINKNAHIMNIDEYPILI